MILALTGATGFVGGHVLRVALDGGHEVRALTRRPQMPHPGITWVEGTLADAPALARLVEGAHAVIHVAGVVNARNLAGFRAGNVAGTQALLDATIGTSIDRLVFVSSLSAREPSLSDYGTSKAEAETLVETAPLGWVIVRPPAIYGPGDREILELFRMAKRGIVALPPGGGRLSVIHAEDLARLLLALATAPTPRHRILEPDDGVAAGWSHGDFARAIGAAVGRRAVPVALPRPLLRVASLADGLVRRGAAKLTADRVRYMCHPDWVVRTRPDPALWQPQIATADGLKATADWYRDKGWL
ncbi:NAD-dependent epimerase/dehydratase family protein [Sphingomonas jatrophae]|uniref:Nucleoside-diphosphate-sugar epimerase n=1 Tax=Sphingomonas jatrophae TaxID=1166337 RepID=A0A1I6LBC9_9SPHN|nr:NAD-dependent epimerase/dehydratase family protein [Sphingomonas jatrophae]SFS00747.1 Nucleoside-diphosphate-sugar epimerase [Sphingomonas jatrophae]